MDGNGPASRQPGPKPRGRDADNGHMTSPGEVPAVALRGGGQLPMIGFGTWKLRADNAREAVRAALAAGYRHLDTATMYANEDEVGEALADSGLERYEVFVTTKIRPSDAGRARKVLQASLRALRTDYLDLWLVHWPPPRTVDSRQLWNEVLEVQADGYVRDVGVSNYSLPQLDDLTKSSGQTPAVNQIDWGPTFYDPTVLAGHAERRIAVEGYSPLKNTDLDDPVLAKIAAAHGVSTAQVVLRWHLEHGITVIPKSARPERIAANFDLLGFSLTAAEIAAIDKMGRH
jgi:2,5-diketo-D-gluconate reductase A